jgi:hypothetical protein
MSHDLPDFLHEQKCPLRYPPFAAGRMPLWRMLLLPVTNIVFWQRRQAAWRPDLVSALILRLLIVFE